MDIDNDYGFEAGQKIEINKVLVYPRYCVNKTNIEKSGTFYLWDTKICNDRIRITNRPENAGKLGQITGWINVSDITGIKPEFAVGDKVIVNGDIYTYSDGSGNTLTKKKATMYIVDVLDENEFKYNLGLATSPTRTRQGWGNKEFVKKCLDEDKK